MFLTNEYEKIEGVKIIYGKKPGKTLAIFAGVHGNEKAGIHALNKVYKKCEIKRGVVYFVKGSPAALKRNIRFVEKDLNRCFLPSSDNGSYEEKRAKELIPILQESDALLDLHGSPAKESLPFAICEKEAWDVAKRFDVSIISFDWNKIEAGAADGYMHQLNKPGICLECGPIKKYKNFIRFAESSIYQFLQFYGAIGFGSVNLSLKLKQKRYIRVLSAVYKKSENFRFKKEFSDFEPLIPGEVFAVDDSIKYIAKPGQCIIFPHEKAKVDQETCILGKEVFT